MEQRPRRPSAPWARLLPTAAAMPLMLSSAGCLRHTRAVQIVHPPPVVMDATADQLVGKLNAQFDAIQTLTATVEVVASIGGAATGKVTEYHPFHGYIIIEKPHQLRVILQVPVLLSKGMDMVSNGTDFKMVIPLRSEALIGKDEVVKPSAKPLENLRPATFFDSMLIRGLQPDELVSLTESSREVQPETRKQDAIEEPDYDLTMLRHATGNMLNTARVVHFNRTSLLPYQQDIYDSRGRLTTTSTYDNWQSFPSTGADGKSEQIQFPTKIHIDRPVDQYTLTITVDKVTANQKMEPDQFELCIPAGYRLRDMDDPDAPATTAPSVPCEQQSQH